MKHVSDLEVSCANGAFNASKMCCVTWITWAVLGQHSGNYLVNTRLPHVTMSRIPPTPSHAYSTRATHAGQRQHKVSSAVESTHRVCWMFLLFQIPVALPRGAKKVPVRPLRSSHAEKKNSFCPIQHPHTKGASTVHVLSKSGTRCYTPLLLGQCK